MRAYYALDGELRFIEQTLQRRTEDGIREVTGTGRYGPMFGPKSIA